MIPVNEPCIGEKELENVIKTVKSGWISSRGPCIDEFEAKFSSYCGVRYGVTTSSGTAALHLALASLGIGKGDEVIIPAFTMIATAFAVIYTGATAVLVDSEKNTWNIDPSQIESKISDRTKAILPVHIYGHPVNIDPILHLAKKYGLHIVEDAAEAHGAEYRGRKTGGLGDVGCFSFYANKIITTGEGGMVVTNDEGLAERARLLKDLAHCKDRRFAHTEIGFNYRMTNLQGAFGIAQLESIDAFVEKKRWMASLYNRLLSEIDGIRLPPEEKWAKNVYWMYAILVEDDFKVKRDELMTRLRDKGIETRAFFIPMHQQPIFNRMGLFEAEKYPVAEELGEKGLYLPSGLTITEDEIRYICKAIEEIRNEKRGGNI